MPADKPISAFVDTHHSLWPVDRIADALKWYRTPDPLTIEAITRRRARARRVVRAFLARLPVGQHDLLIRLARDSSRTWSDYRVLESVAAAMLAGVRRPAQISG